MQLSVGRSKNEILYLECWKVDSLGRSSLVKKKGPGDGTVNGIWNVAVETLTARSTTRGSPPPYVVCDETLCGLSIRSSGLRRYVICSLCLRYVERNAR